MAMELAKAGPQAQSLASLDRGGIAADSAKKLEQKLSDDRKLAMAQGAPAADAQRVAGEAGAAKLKAVDKLDGIKVAAADVTIKIAAKLVAAEPKAVARAMQKVLAAGIGGATAVRARQLLDQAKAGVKP